MQVEQHRERLARRVERQLTPLRQGKDMAQLLKRGGHFHRRRTERRGGDGDRFARGPFSGRIVGEHDAQGRLVQFRLQKQSTRGAARSRQRRKRPIELAPRILVFPQILVGLRERQTESRLESVVRDARGFLQMQGLLDYARRIRVLLQPEQALSDDCEELQLRLWIDV